MSGEIKCLVVEASVSIFGLIGLGFQQSTDLEIRDQSLQLSQNALISANNTIF